MAQQINFFFDWDDNVVSMPTKIMLRHQKTAQELSVSTQAFAHIRSKIGKADEYLDYEIDPHPHTGSMRFFRDDPSGKRNFFLEDIMRGIVTSTFRSQSFDAFKTALSNAETARNTFIITARGHSRENFRDGLRCLKKLRWIKHEIPLENIWGISSPHFADLFKKTFGEHPPETSVQNPSEGKTEVMIRLHDQIDKRPLSSRCVPVLSPDGNSAGVFHLSGFSDDDLGNYEAGRRAFIRWIKEGRWPHTKFTLFYTGPREGDSKAEVLTSQGHTRPLRLNEESEWIRVFEAKYGRSPASARKMQAGALEELFASSAS